jgi:hypothetical protein
MTDIYVRYCLYDIVMTLIFPGALSLGFNESGLGEYFVDVRIGDAFRQAIGNLSQEG